jgi:hypothetical protein
MLMVQEVLQPPAQAVMPEFSTCAGRRPADRVRAIDARRGSPHAPTICYLFPRLLLLALYLPCLEAAERQTAANQIA